MLRSKMQLLGGISDASPTVTVLVALVSSLCPVLVVLCKDYREYLTERQVAKLESIFLRYDQKNTGGRSKRIQIECKHLSIQLPHMRQMLSL